MNKNNRQKNPSATEQRSVQILSELCWNWINSRGHRTKTELAEEVGVNEATVRRLLNDSTLPSTENLMRFVSFFGDRDTRFEYSIEDEHSLADRLAMLLPLNSWTSAERFQQTREEFEAQLDSSFKILVFEKAIRPCGTTEEEIKKDLGAKGLMALEDLIESKTLTKQDQLIRPAADKKIWRFSPSKVVESINANLANYFLPEDPSCLVYHKVGTISAEGYNEIQKELKEISFRLRELMEEYPGEIPFYSSLILDRAELEKKTALIQKRKEMDHSLRQ